MIERSFSLVEQTVSDSVHGKTIDLIDVVFKHAVTGVERNRGHLILSETWLAYGIVVALAWD